MPVLPVGTVTFLFTDIEGSSRLWEQFPDPMRAALEWHDCLLRETIEAHSGHIFKTVGDGACAVFHSADEALRAAHTAQQELYALPASEFGQLKVRMALLTGQANLRDGDYFGSSVNRTARLCAIAHGGQIILAHATAGLLSTITLSALNEAVLRDMGLHRLKDLRDAEHVYQFIHPDLPADFPPLRSLDRFTHNLPSQLTSLIGRDADVADALRLLTGRREKEAKAKEKEADTTLSPAFLSPSSAPARLLTLTGTGGCGKTRLALQVGAELLDAYPGGVWFVDLAALADAALLPQIIAQAMGESVEQANRAASDALIDILKLRTLLLILDNCEHLVEGCARLTDALLRACPHLRVLATSRENLDIAGETTLRVAPLPAPAAQDSITPDDLMRYEAARLFVERAQAALPSWTLTPQNASSVSQICRQMDGIPLALELAARRVKGMTVDTIAHQLSDSLGRLTGSRTDPPRQQTLDAAIGWSYDLLTDAECVLLRRLSVFAGGWTLDAAEIIGADDSNEEADSAVLAPFDVPDVLMRLVDKSLVVFEEALDGEGRYRLLETIRHYSLKRLEQSGERDALLGRHITWCLELAEQAEPHLQGAEQAAWLNRLEREHDNLRAALKWDSRCRNPPPLGECVMALLVHARLSDRGARLAGRHIGAQSERRALNARKSPERGGHPGMAAGRLQNAQCWHEESLTIYRELDDRFGEAKTLNNLSLVAYSQENFAAMRAYLEQCLALYLELREEALAARVLNNLGRAATAQGEYDVAKKFLHESLHLSRTLGIKNSEANTLNNLGEVAFERQDYSVADEYYKQSLLIQSELADRQEMAVSLQSLGESAALQGKDRRAVSLFASAATLRTIVAVPLSVVNQIDHECRIETLRQRLGIALFNYAWTRGIACSLDEMLNFD